MFSQTMRKSASMVRRISTEASDDISLDKWMKVYQGIRHEAAEIAGKEIEIKTSHIQREIHGLRQEVSGLKAEVSQSQAQIRADMHNEISGLRSEVKKEMADFKSEVKKEMADFKSEVKKEISDLKTAMHIFQVESKASMKSLEDNMTSQINIGLAGVYKQQVNHFRLMLLGTGVLVSAGVTANQLLDKNKNTDVNFNAAPLNSPTLKKGGGEL